MKKRIVVGLLIVGVVGSGWWWLRQRGEVVGELSQELTDRINTTTLIVDFGDHQATYSGELVGETSVLDLLRKYEGTEMELVVEHYDFGDLVKAIDGYENTTQRAWIYFVNGNSGEVGASEKMVGPGDIVEWKYMKPIY